MSRILANDQTLIDRLSLNDTDAFEELYRQYWHGLYLYSLKKLQSREDAKIIVRTIFIDLWEKRHSLPVSFSLSKFLYEEVRKTVVKCLSKKLAEPNDIVWFENRLSGEFSVQSLQAARKPVTRKYAMINNPTELIRQQTGQAGTEHYNTFATVKWMFQSLTNKLSFITIFSYHKNLCI
jgi:DNA-directed RNA polymerase specialized sigma24 family protein